MVENPQVGNVALRPSLARPSACLHLPSVTPRGAQTYWDLSKSFNSPEHEVRP